MQITLSASGYCSSNASLLIVMHCQWCCLLPAVTCWRSGRPMHDDTFAIASFASCRSALAAINAPILSAAHSLLYHGQYFFMNFCNNCVFLFYQTKLIYKWSTSYLRLPRERLRSILMSTYVCVCLFVCLSVMISPKPHERSLHKFLCMLFMAVARPSWDKVTKS